MFFGFARVATPLIPGLSSFMSPIARWSVFALDVAGLAVLHVPVLVLRYALLGPGGRRGSACSPFFVGAWNLDSVLVIVVVMAIRKC